MEIVYLLADTLTIKVFWHNMRPHKGKLRKKHKSKCRTGSFFTNPGEVVHVHRQRKAFMRFAKVSAR